MATTTPPRHSLIRRKSTWLGLVFGLVMGGWAMTAQAFFSLGMIPGLYIPQMYYKYGAVYTRAIVPGPTGRPVYVEYSSNGAEAREIGEAIGQYERAQVMAGATYRALLQRLADTREHHPESEVLTAAAYRGKAFKTVTGETIHKPSIASNTLTVVVRPDEQLFSTDGKDLLLLELPIKESVTPDTSSISLLLSPEGNILHQSSNSIGFRVGFFGKDGQVSDGLRRDRDAQIYGPMPNTVVTLGGYIAGGVAATGDDGKYSMNYFLPACPGFTFEYTTPAYLELQYKRFNPRGSSYMPYYMVRQDYDFCNGLGVYSLNAAMVIATMATPIKSPHDFPVDLMVLDGAAQLKNVKVADETAYNAETSEHDRYVQDKYDFDGDEKPDFVVPGKKVTKTIDGEEKQVFVTTSTDEAELQGIYLSTRHEAAPANTEETAPDFTRLIDTAPDFKDRGLLDSISKEDLKDTDIYVFRESTGQLVAERRGLHEDELYRTYSGVDEAQGSFRYTIQLRGSAENTFAISGRTGEANFTKWQSAGGFKEEFQKRTANHLKAGEQVRIIAINRPTGYMGSTRIQLQSALTGNMLNLNSQRIELTPPNLKIWAERKNKIEKGMTRGDEKKQLIGNEGAGLGSDVSIAIYTDWRDSDGSPLPEELADYGYTGRLAKIVAANQLAPAGANNLSQFRIKPGQQVQVIHLPEKVLAKQHLYLQVAGQPENRNPDFSSNGQATGILKYRPTRYVPVQVPLHDEEASELARQAYRKADRENPQLNLKKPEPMYAWQYRPEMQFSLYELNIEEVRRVDAQNSIDQLYLDKKPVIANTDKLLEIYYDLLKSEFSGLDAWSYTGEKELVLALGEQEIKVTFGQDQVIKFENLDHLGALDVDDFLSLRIYTNNDQGNSLVEWAFEYLSVFADEDEEINEEGKYYYLSADNPSVEIKAVLAGYYNRREAIKKPETVRWGVEGAGSVSPTVDGSGDTGIFATTITVPPVAGTKARIYANLQGGDAKAFFKEILVIPGEAANISAHLTGQLFARGVGELEVTVLVTDRNGNIVVNGLGADLSIEGEGEIFESDDSLIGGGAKFKIRNAKLASKSNTLVVRVDGVEGRFPFSVEALGITPPSLQEVYEDQVVELKFDIPGVDVSKIKPEMFVVDVTKGQILGEGGTTDGEGKLVYRWHTGYVLGDAKVLYSDDAGQKASLEYEILPRPETLVSGKKPLVLVAGGKTTVGVNRASGQLVEVAVPQQVQVRLKGSPAEAINLQIGDQENPNKQMLMALSPGDLGRSQFVNNGVKVLAAPGFRYQQSSLDGRPLAYNYKGYGLSVSDLPAFEQAAALGGLDIVLNFEGDGIFFAWQDLLTFERHQDTLVVKRKIDDVQIDEQRFPLPIVNELSKFTLSVQDRNYTYDLDGLQGSVAIAPAVTAKEGSKLRLLAGKGMGLRKFYVAASSASPLITVNGQTAGAAVLFNEQGEALLDIQLTADSLNMNYQAIPITVGSERLTVSLYSPERAAMLLSATPERQDFQLDAVRMLLGRDIRDISGFSQQTLMAVRADENAETEGQKIRALLKVFATLPEGYHLTGKIDVLASFVSEQSEVFQQVLKEELVAAIAGYSYRPIELSYKKVLSLLVMAELVQSDSETAEYIAASIRSQSDLQLWMDWMAMPANGWVLFDPAVPYIGQSCTANVVYAYEGTADQIPYNPCRLTGAQFASWINALTATSPIYSESPDVFLAFLDGVHDGLMNSSYAFRRELFVFQQGDIVTSYDPTSLFISQAHAVAPLAIIPAIVALARISAVIAKRLGKNFLRNLLRFAVGKSNSRIPPMLYIASVAYLWHSTDCDAGESLCKPLVSRDKPEEARKKITSSLVQFAKGLAFAFNRDAWRMVDDLKDNGAYRCSVLGFTHGHMYEMFMTAYYHGLGNEKIVALDRNRKVPLYGNRDDAKQMISRRPDIEFEGANTDDESNIWVELKSISVTDKYKDDDTPDLPSEAQFLRRFPRFVVPGGNAQGEPVYHRQFLLDRIAFEGEYLDGKINMNGDFRWQFHQWRPANKRLKGFIRDRYVNNGIPTRTKIPGTNDTYLDKAKERLSEAPGFASNPPGQALKSEFPVSGRYRGDAFYNPLFAGLGEVIDEDKLADALLNSLGYSSADIADVKNKMKDAKAVAEAFEEVAKSIPSVEFGHDFDVTNLIPDKIIEKGRDYVDMKLAGYVGCEDD